MHGQWAMNAILTESYDNNITRSLGGLAYNGCMHMNEAQGSSGTNETKYWTFFGDPSVVIRTDQPSNFNLSYEELVLIGQSEFVVDVGIDGALAALSVNGELIGSAYSDGGVAVIDLGSNSTQPGELDLIVTGYNKFPYEGTVMVASPDGAFVTVDNVDIDYGTDNTITPGETIDITVTVENLGNESSSNVEVSLFEMIDNPYISIVDGSDSINNLLDGSSAYLDLSFSVSGNAPYGHTFALQLELDSEENDWSSTLNMTVQALVESFESGTFADAAWEFEGDADWTIDQNNQFDGLYSAKSGAIDNSMTSDLVLTMNVLEDGQISFYKKVSCEDVGAYTGNYYDYLAFYIDGVEQNKWAGEIAWSNTSFPVSAGEHTFMWRFNKDQGVVAGSDAVWIDNITFPPVESSGSMLGDINGDMTINVLDVIQAVNMALGLQEADYSTADLNGDGTINVLDIIQIVNMILENRGLDATSSIIYKNDQYLCIDADGFIGGVQMTLSHKDDFIITLSNESLFSKFYTKENLTTVIVAAPYSEELFSVSGEYDITDIIVANSSEQINVTMPDKISLSSAYPNPFNPSTTVKLFSPSVQNDINISIYNLMGQQVSVLHNGQVSSGYNYFTWDASNFSSGVYLIRTSGTNFKNTQKLMLIK